VSGAPPCRPWCARTRRKSVSKSCPVAPRAPDGAVGARMRTGREHEHAELLEVELATRLKILPQRARTGSRQQQLIDRTRISGESRIRAKSAHDHGLLPTGPPRDLLISGGAPCRRLLAAAEAGLPTTRARPAGIERSRSLPCHPEPPIPPSCRHPSISACSRLVASCDRDLRVSGAVAGDVEFVEIA